MSLDASIRENTAALQALTAALAATCWRAPLPEKNPVSTKRGQAPIVDKGDPSPTNNTRGKEEAEDVAASAATLDYDKDVKPSVLRLAAQSRDALKLILAEFGVEKGGQVPPEKLPSFLAQVQGAL